MPKSLAVLLIPFLASGTILAGYAPAQQTPAAATSPASGQAGSSQAGTSKTQTSTAKKPAAAAAKTAAPVVLKTQRDKASYAWGMKLGAGLHGQGLTLDPALVARGLKDAQSGAKTALTEDEARTALEQLRQEVQQKMEAANRKEGETFLAANKTKPGVVTLPSGLQYKIVTQGNGPKPTASDTVTVNYRGTFVSGEEFDSSSKRGPATFQVGGVIKGWTEALQLMPVGSKWELFIPADLAYGPNGRPGIPPNATLIFEIELLSIGEQKK